MAEPDKTETETEPTVPVPQPRPSEADTEPPVTEPKPSSPAAQPDFFSGLGDTSEMAKGLVPQKAAATAALDRTRAETIRQAEADMAQSRRAFNATTYDTRDLKPWDQQEQSRKYATDPIQSFGSLGSVFAMIASAFTHAPMEIALNGAAAAMNATRAADEQEYNRAFASWKENTNLAIKRHEMQRQQYQDSLELMRNNMGVGRAKMEAIAASYGDQKTLFLLQNGMDEDMIKLQDQRATAMEHIVSAKEKIERYGFGWATMVNDPLFKITEDQEPDPFKRAAYKLHAYDRAFGVKGQSVESQIMGQYIYEGTISGHERTGEELAKFRNENFGFGSRPSTPAQERTKMVMDKLEKGEITSEQATKELQQIQLDTRAGSTGGNSDLTVGRQKAAFQAQRRNELVAEGKSLSDATAQANKEANAAFPAEVSGNKKDALKAQYDQYQIATNTLIPRSLKTLETYVGAAGIAGKVTRMAERVENVLSKGTKTDREQFERDISQLQLMAPRLLLDQSTGKPLSMEAEKINTIVAGLRYGDTTANTIRALRAIDEQFKQMSERVKQRIEGNWQTTPSAPATPAPASSRKTGRWDQDKPVGSPATQSATGP